MGHVFRSRLVHLVVFLLTKIYQNLADDGLSSMKRSKVDELQGRYLDTNRVHDVSNYNETQDKCLLKHKFLDVVFVIEPQDLESDFLEFKDVVLNTLNLFDMTIGTTQIGLIMNNKVEVKLQASTKTIQTLQYNQLGKVPFNLLETLKTSKVMFDEASKYRVVAAKKVLILILTTMHANANTDGRQVTDFVSSNQDIDVYLLMIGTVTANDFASMDAHMTLYSNNTSAAKSALNNQIVHTFECDPCSPDPCKMSNETCTVDNRVEEGFRCVCSKYDAACSCANYLKCQNGGSCVHSVTSPTRCDCTEGWEGTDCSLRNCEGHFCGRNGHCEVINRKHRRCVCNTGWEGYDCAKANCQGLSCGVDEYCKITDDGNKRQCKKKSRGSCEGLYCIHGLCLFEGNAEESTIICVCNTGYKGKHCDIPTCELNPCGPHGICQEQLNERYKCTCKDGYSGSNCENGNPCDPDPCKNGCKCKESCKHSGGFICSSEDGYLGKTCAVAPPLVQCGTEEIIIEIGNEIWSDTNDISMADGSYLYVSPVEVSNSTQECRSRASNDGSTQRILLQSHFTGCGTIPDVTNGFVVIRNTVWMSAGANQLFSIDVSIFHFECKYSTVLKVSSPVRSIVVENDAPYVGSELKESINSGSLVLCKEVNQCADECPPSLTVNSHAVYTVGERINAIIKPNEEFLGTSGLFIRTLYLSCSARQSVSPLVTLVKNGCSTGSLSTVVVKSSTSVCVSFPVVRVSEDNNEQCDGGGGIYIHAIMSDCPSFSKCSNSMQPTSCEMRSKRQVPDRITMNREVFGPLYIVNRNASGYSFVNSSVLQPSVLHHQGRDDVEVQPESEISSTNGYVLSALFAVLVMFTSILLVAFYKSRHRFRVTVEPVIIENYRVREIESTNLDREEPH